MSPIAAALKASAMVLLAHTSALGVVTYQKVALSSDTAPTLPAGVLFSQYNSAVAPMLSPDGAVMFGFDLQGPGVTVNNKPSVWAGAVNASSPADLRMIARAEQQAPGLAAGLTHTVSWKGAIGTGGFVALQGNIAGSGVTTSNDECIWSGSYLGTSLSYREGTAAPGLTSINYGSLGGNRVLVQGESICFESLLIGGGVNATNDEAFFGGSGSGISKFLRDGDSAGGGQTYFNLTPLAYPGGSAMTFVSSLVGNGWTTGNPQNALIGGGAVIVKRTDPAPGMPAGAIFSTGFNTSNSSCATGGSILFSATVTGGGVVATNNEGLWINGAMIHREGTQLPGLPAGLNVAGTGGTNMLAGSNVAMIATLTGTGVTSANDTALVVGSAGDFHMVAREGTQAPGKPAGVNFTMVNFLLPAMNGGEFLFQCSLTGGAGGVDCVYHGSASTGSMTPILSIGDSFEVTPGVFRTINYIGSLYSGANGGDGKPASMNGGQFVVALGFTNNSTGVFVGNLHPCDAPTISVHPADAGVCDGSSVLLSVTANGAGLSYQWRKDSNNILGANDPTYSIALADIADIGSYDVVVSNGCGQVTSNPADVEVWVRGSGDMNADGKVDGRDLQDFTATVINPFAATDRKRCAADVDQSGFVDTFDVPMMVDLMMN